MTFFLEQICEYALKTTPRSLELFPFVKQLAGPIKEQLDAGPSTNEEVLRNTSLPSQVLA